MTDYVVACGVADVRGEPSADSELVTQALLNMPVYAGEPSGEWVPVKLVDYMGWMHLATLAPAPRKSLCRLNDKHVTPLVAVVTAAHTELYAEAEGTASLGQAYLTSLLTVLDTSRRERVQVALPGERVAWLERSDVELRQRQEPYPRLSAEEIVELAQYFLDVPYHWGGTSWAGIDCSGFVQLCYRAGGYFIPRDADQQDGFLPYELERPQMRAGDLIFFGSQSITHVALALNDHEYIHAEGQHHNRVLVNSFLPTDPHYYPRLDQIVWSIKRVIV